MPDGKTHALVGAGSGAVYSGYRAKDQDQDWWVEVIGGAIGGYVGGKLPDWIEPAVSPWHRSTAHSGAVGGGVLAIGNAIAACGAACRENAETCKSLRMQQQGDVFVFVPLDPLSNFFANLFEFLWRLAAGFVNGLAAGYVSHLTLDAMTARSIPLLPAEMRWLQ